MVDTTILRESISSAAEWLLVRELGSTFALLRGEIELVEDGDRVKFSFLDESGIHLWRLNSFEIVDGEIILNVAGAFGRNRETIRLIARARPADLLAEAERARREKANEIAELIKMNFANVKVGRVALNKEGGRLAQIQFQLDGRPLAAIADVTRGITVESMFTAGILWLEKLASRKKRAVHDLWVICERPHAKNARKLHTLLAERYKRAIVVVEISRKQDPPALVPANARKLSDLWREKARKLVLPREPRISDIGRMIVELSPGQIDIVFSRQGETLRFQGLPFARVRTVIGQEKAWFGVRKEMRSLSNANWNELVSLVDELQTYRSASPPHKRHELYRANPESWLESIFRRNIRLLDANLILSPIYNQFRSANDKIDLLALRRDGRLVIIELKAQPDREMVFQAADYWRKIELQRRRGVLEEADLFEGRTILDKPALVYLVAPAWSFHRDFEFFARAVSPEIEIWRFELHQNWRQEVRVLARIDYRPGV